MYASRNIAGAYEPGIGAIAVIVLEGRYETYSYAPSSIGDEVNRRELVRLYDRAKRKLVERRFACQKR